MTLLSVDGSSINKYLSIETVYDQYFKNIVFSGYFQAFINDLCFVFLCYYIKDSSILPQLQPVLTQVKNYAELLNQMHNNKFKQQKQTNTPSSLSLAFPYRRKHIQQIQPQSIITYHIPIQLTSSTPVPAPHPNYNTLQSSTLSNQQHRIQSITKKQLFDAQIIRKQIQMPQDNPFLLSIAQQNNQLITTASSVLKNNKGSMQKQLTTEEINAKKRQQLRENRRRVRNLVRNYQQFYDFGENSANGYNHNNNNSRNSNYHQFNTNMNMDNTAEVEVDNTEDLEQYIRTMNINNNYNESYESNCNNYSIQKKYHW